MQVREVIEFAALVSRHGPVLALQQDPISEASLKSYWSASKRRFDRWQRAFKTYETLLRNAARPARPNGRWQIIRPTLEEILTTELLTRVWTAVVCIVDRAHERQDAEPIARSVFNGHLDARLRVLNLLAHGPAIDLEAAAAVNRLRCRLERWTDMLIGQLAAHHDVGEFAVHPEQAVEFAREFRGSDQAASNLAWRITLTSLRTAFDGVANLSRENDDVNSAIVSSMLECFHPETFDSFGLFRSLWMQRLSSTTNDSQALIADLLAVDDRDEPEDAMASIINLAGFRRGG